MHVVWLLAVACDQVHGLIGVIFPILFVVLPSYVCESIKKEKSIMPAIMLGTA